MRASLAILVGASLVLAGCDEQLASGGAFSGGESLSAACAALVAAQAGVPTETVAISGSGGANFNMIARVPGNSTPWVCEVRGGNRIMGVYPSNQPSQNLITNQTTSNAAPVYRVAPTGTVASQTFTSQGRTYRVVTPGSAPTTQQRTYTVQPQTVTTQPRTYVTQPQATNISNQTYAPRTVSTSPRTYRVATQARTGQTEYRTLTPSSQVRTTQPTTYRVVTQQPTTQARTVTQPSTCINLFGNCRTAVGPSVPNQPTYRGGAEPSYHQPLYSDVRTGPTQVGNRIEYVVPSQTSPNF